MNGQPPIFVLVHEAILLQDRPRLLHCDGLHAVQNVIRNFRPAVGKTLAMPLRRVLDHVLGGEKSLLCLRTGDDHGADYQTANTDTYDASFHLASVSICLMPRLVETSLFQAFAPYARPLPPSPLQAQACHSV